MTDTRKINDYEIIILENESQWLKYCLGDFNTYERVRLIENRFPCTSSFVANILKIHFSKRINEYINLPLKWVWNHYFARNICDSKNKKIILIIYDWNILSNNTSFLTLLRRHFDEIIIVYMFTNIASLSGAMQNKFVDKLKDYYDLVYAFDPQDSQKYQFNYSPLLYSACDEVKPNKLKRDVFYVGEAKDRLKKLHRIYERLKELEVSSGFYITKVDSSEQIYDGEIIYNHPLTYYECIENIKGSNCLLDIIQGGSEGYTIKTCEAVYYDKLLITTNKKIKNAPFYNKDYILIIDDETDIKKEFLLNPKRVHYSDQDKAYFSVRTFLNKLEEDINGFSHHPGD